GPVYLDAGYPCASYDPTVHEYDSTLRVDLDDLQAKLAQLSKAGDGPNASTLMHQLIDNALPQFESDLREWQKDLEIMPPALAAPLSSPPSPIQRAIAAGEQKYTKISAPILAIFAVPADFGPVLRDNPSQAAFEAKVDAEVEAQVKSFETGSPAARVA